MIKVGDLVVPTEMFLKFKPTLKGFIGEVFEISHGSYGVRFNGWTGGHNASRFSGDVKDCWWVDGEEYLTLFTGSIEDYKDLCRQSPIIRKIREIKIRRESLGYRW